MKVYRENWVQSQAQCHYTNMSTHINEPKALREESIAMAMKPCRNSHVQQNYEKAALKQHHEYSKTTVNIPRNYFPTIKQAS